MSDPRTLAMTLERDARDETAQNIARGHVLSLKREPLGDLLTACLAEFIREARKRRVDEESRRIYRESPAGQDEREYRHEVHQARRQRESERLRLLRADPAEYRARFTIEGAIQRFRDEVRDELRGELLHEFFGLPDGTAITWGEATIVQHRAAARAYLEAVDQDLMGLARHEEAIATLEESGARCLNRLAQVAA